MISAIAKNVHEKFTNVPYSTVYIALPIQNQLLNINVFHGMYSAIQLLNTHLFYSVRIVFRNPVAEHTPVLQRLHCSPQSSFWIHTGSTASTLYSAIHLLNVHLFYSVRTVLRNPVAEHSPVLQCPHCTPQYSC